MDAGKVIVGILLLTAAVDCQPKRPTLQRPRPRLSDGRGPPTTLKTGPPPSGKGLNAQPQPQPQGATTQDPLAELVSALTPILKTLAPVLQSLAPSLQKLGPVLESLLTSLLPQNSTGGGAQTNPLGSLLGNLLNKPNPVGNLVGGLLGKPSGTPLASIASTVGSVAGGLIGTASSSQNPNKSPPESVVGKVLNPVGNRVGGLLGKGSPLTDTLGSVVGGLSNVASSALTQGVKGVDSVVGRLGKATDIIQSSVNSEQVNSAEPLSALSYNPTSNLVPGHATSPMANAGPVAPSAGRQSPTNNAPHNEQANWEQEGQTDQIYSDTQQQPSYQTRMSSVGGTQETTQGGSAGESCESSCPYTYVPVCTTTGGTYDNICLLQCSGGELQCYGECPCATPADAWSVTCPCDPYEYDPVCTADGEQLNNKCQAICLHKEIACSSHCPC